MFDDCIKKDNFPELENLFAKSSTLPPKRIEKYPSMGFVEAQKPSWKKKKPEQTLGKELENLEKETPFLIPLRWIENEGKDCFYTRG